MTWADITLLIARATKESGVVNSFYYGDANHLNKENNIKYPAVILTANSVNYTSDRVDSYNCNLIYADRLPQREEKRDFEAVMIHSAAFDILKDIINRFRGYNSDLGGNEEWMYNVNYTTNTFYRDEVFMDGLTGAYASINIDVDNEVGECWFEDIDQCAEFITQLLPE